MKRQCQDHRAVTPRTPSKLADEYQAFFHYQPPPPWVDPYRRPSAFDDSVPVSTSNATGRWPEHA